jgi:hypothetical protein
MHFGKVFYHKATLPLLTVDSDLSQGGWIIFYNGGSLNLTLNDE